MALSVYFPDSLVQAGGGADLYLLDGIFQADAGTGPPVSGPGTPGAGGTGGFGAGGSPVPAWQPVAKDKTFQFIVDGTSTTIIEGSNDPRVISDPANAVWLPLKDSVTGVPIVGVGNEAFENSYPWKYIRANRISFTTGTTRVYMGT